MSALRILRSLLVVTASVCAFIWASHSAAQAATSMSCPSGKVPATTAKGGSIEISSFQFGVGRGISSAAGGSADRESSAPSVSEIVITKTQDSASPNFFKSAAGGHMSLGTCTITFDKGSQPKAIPYLTITLTNTMVSSYSLSSGGDRPTESITLNFAKIEYSNKIEGATGNTNMGVDLKKPAPTPTPKK